MFRKIAIICLIVLMMGTLLTACSDGAVDVPQNDVNMNPESQDADEQSETVDQAVGVEDTGYIEEAPIPPPSPIESEAISEDDAEEIAEEILTPEQSALIAFRQFLIETHTTDTWIVNDAPWGIGNIVNAELVDLNNDEIPELILVIDLGDAAMTPTGPFYYYPILIIGYTGRAEVLYRGTKYWSGMAGAVYSLIHGVDGQVHISRFCGHSSEFYYDLGEDYWYTIHTVSNNQWVTVQSPLSQLGITQTRQLRTADAPNGAGWALLTQIDRRIAESRPAAPQPPAPQQANVLQLLYDGLVNHAFSELIINWDNGTRTVFYSFYHAISGDIAWNMISRTGNVSEVFPTFARGNNAVIIGFPRTTTRLYYLYGNGEGIFGDETLSWSFRNTNGEISLFG